MRLSDKVAGTPFKSFVGKKCPLIERNTICSNDSATVVSEWESINSIDGIAYLI
jgi:hypothetical protein